MGKELAQYVRVRVTDLEEINLALFDFDRHNAIYYFVLNSSEEIYLRYGGRDAASAGSYLDLQSFEIALRKGLEEHREIRKQPERPKRKVEEFFAKDIVSLNREILAKNRCVECHLVADYEAVDLEKAGQLFKPRDMYRSPDIRTLGLNLNVPKGLEILEPTGVAKEAGIEPGDVISSLDQTRVLTFADLQYHLDQVDRKAKKLPLAVQRGGETVEVELTLPNEWWVTDLAHRHWSIEPQLYFESTPLNEAEKVRLSLPKEGFASRVNALSLDLMFNEAHELKVGDIITAVGGQQSDELTRDVMTHLRLRYQAGAEVELEVLREGKERKLSLKTGQLSFRK